MMMQGGGDSWNRVRRMNEGKRRIIVLPGNGAKFSV